MKTTKIILLTFALAMLSAGGFAQLRYGVRGEVSVNNPSIDVASLDILMKQAPVLLFGVGGELGLPVNNLSLEGALLYGNESIRLVGEGVSGKSQFKTHYIDVPLTANIKVDIGAPVTPVLSLGPVFKMYVSEEDRKDTTIFDKFNKDEFLVGIIAGAGVRVMDMVTVGVNYRYLLSGENRRLEDKDNYQKGLFTLSASVYF
ncbi:MAG TPA: porin family protein [Bacteroidales bacterium]|jgi:opacity protein-like surface antigen|nr:porin family protein [Bacteroidales bacterium]